MRLMISALLLATAATAPALAQDRDHGDHGGWHHGGDGQQGGQQGGSGNHHGGPGGGNPGGGNPGGAPRPAPAPQPQAPQAPAAQPGRPPQGGGWQGGGWQGGGGRPDHGQSGSQWHNQPGNAPQGGGNPPVVRPREGLWAGNRDDHGRPGGWDGRPGGGNNNDHDGWGGRPGGSNGWNQGRPGNDGNHGRPDGWNQQHGGGNWDHGRPGGGWDRGPGRDWNRGWRDDHRYDWRGWRDNHREIYHVDRYRAPRGWGWGYRRFGIGVQLDPILFASSYWIADPWYYRLPPAYGPYRWVRYYNDALLVDIESGFVVDEIPDFFW